eukprot:scaffold2880_cov62-Isochrysis_galbana.AAC.1
MGEPSSKPAASNSPMTAGTPPARWKRSHRYSPAGCTFASSGRAKPYSCQSWMVSATPAWRAMA